MRRRLGSLCAFAAVALTCVSLPCRAQEKALTAAGDRSAIEQFYDKRAAVEKELFPQIVFIPGIMGSTIKECDPKGENCKVLWGTLEALAARGTDLELAQDKNYQSDVLDRMLGKNIYGEFLEGLENRYPGRDVLNIFAYDWRRSSASNAEALSKFMCGLQEKYPNRPIHVVAHSMGGLVLRHWLKFGVQGCSSGKPNIRHIVFVATPHLGSSKTIKSAVDGYTFYFEGTSFLTGFLARQERWLLAALNKAGPTFPSFYELLPIQSSEYCRTKVALLASLPKALVAGEEQNAINAYDSRIWREFKLLKWHDRSASDIEASERALTNALRAGEEFSCNLVDFDPSSIAPVTYIVGQAPDRNTVGWVALKRKRPSGDVEVTYSEEFGDGVVPHYSAADAVNSRTWQTVLLRGDHLSILNSPVLKQIVAQWFADAERNSAASLQKHSSAYGHALHEEYKRSGRLIPLPLHPSQWRTDEARFAIDFNRRLLLQKTSLREVLRTAGRRAEESTLSMDDATALISLSGERATEPALLLVGEYAYQVGQYWAAQTAAARALDAIAPGDQDRIPGATRSVRLPVLQPVEVDIAVGLYAWSSLRLGDVVTARRAFEVLKGSGNEVLRSVAAEGEAAATKGARVGGAAEPWKWATRARVIAASSAPDEWQAVRKRAGDSRSPGKVKSEGVAAKVEQLRAALSFAHGQIHVGVAGTNQFKLGQIFRFEVQSEVSGQLILLDINANGEVIQIYPNRFVDGRVPIDRAKPALIPDASNNAYGGFSGFQAVEPVGTGRLLALVVPDIPALSNIVSGRGFSAEKDPVAYLSGLVEAIVARSASPDPHAWAFGETVYEIVP